MALMPQPDIAAPDATDQRPWPNPRRAWTVALLLSLASIASQFDRVVLNLTVEPVKAEFGLDDTSFALLQGVAFGIFYTLGAVPLGRLGVGVDQRQPSGGVDHGQISSERGGPGIGAGRVDASRASTPELKILSDRERGLGIAVAREGPAPERVLGIEREGRVGADTRLARPGFGGVQKRAGFRGGRGLVQPGEELGERRRRVSPRGAGQHSRDSGERAADRETRRPAI